VSRYYLHIPEPDSDPEGTELPDLAAARREALLAAREILAHAIKQARDDVPLHILITDASGQVLDTVHLAEVLPKAILGWKGTK
jgi:hypothetical protein